MKKIAFYLVISLLIFLPFQPFLVTVTDWFFFSYLRDILILIYFLTGFYWRVKNSKPLIYDHLEWLMMLFGLWFVLSDLFISQNLLALIYSLRYSFEIMLVFWSVRSFSFDKSKQSKIFFYLSLIFVIEAVIGFLLVFVLPKYFLVQFGYSAQVAIGQGIWFSGAKLPAAQIIPDGLIRAQSTMSGPIQFAAYLLVIIGLFIARFKVKNILLVLAIALLFLTFTRSAWIGLAVIISFATMTTLQSNLVIPGTPDLKNKKARILTPIFIGMTILIFVVAGFFTTNFGQKFYQSIIIRSGSSTEHISSIDRIWQEIPKIGFWGRGVGASGPASFRAYPNSPRAVENSYLRFYEELGIVGLWIFIWLIFSILKNCFTEPKNNSQLDDSDIFRWGGGLGLLGIAIAALFSDTFTEVIPMLYLGIILGLGQPLKKKTKSDPISILDVPIFPITKNEMLQKIDQMISSQQPHQVCTINAEFIIESQRLPQFKRLLQSADLNITDGAGIIAAAEYLKKEDVKHKTKNGQMSDVKCQMLGYRTIFYFVFGLITGLRLLLAPRSFEKIPERITGVDLTEELVKNSPYRIFFLGGDQDSSWTRQKLFQRYPNLKVAGIEYGGKISKDGTPEDSKLVQRIVKSAADILLVGFGAPKQEFFINQYKNELNVPVMIGVGGSIDFLIGRQKRSPKIFQQLSLEWLWRLITNLFDRSRRQRIFNAVIKFPWLIFISRLGKSI